MFMSSPDLLTKQPWARGELEACSGQDTKAGHSPVLCCCETTQMGRLFPGRNSRYWHPCFERALADLVQWERKHPARVGASCQVFALLPHSCTC